MKRIVLSCIIIALLFLMQGCRTNEIIVDEYMPDTDTGYEENDNSINAVLKMTTDEIDKLLDMTKREVLSYLGTEYEIVRAGAEGAFDGYYFAERGLTFIFFPGGFTLEMLLGYDDIMVEAIGPNHVEVTLEDGSSFRAYWPSEDTVWSISVSDNVEIQGVRQGMNFEQIQEYFGAAEIIETWIEYVIHTAYMIEYQIGSGWYRFYSFESDGTDSFLDISRIMPVFSSESSADTQ